MTETTQETTAESTENQVQLTVDDLSNLKQIFDLAISRGAFKGTEMAAVGVVYSKLDVFLQAIAVQISTNQESETTETTEGAE